MYVIRADDAQGLLKVELSGRVTTAEGLRAVSQALTLAEAGNIWSIACDLTGVRKGPGGLLLIAAALHASFRPNIRLAFYGDDAQQRFVQRIANFSGLAEAVRTFPTSRAAVEWLAPSLRKPRRLSETERRHAEHILGIQSRPATRKATVRHLGSGPAA